jgi:hypothetical protein
VRAPIVVDQVERSDFELLLNGPTNTKSTVATI